MSRSANWMFTVNNYDATTVAQLLDLKCGYIIFGKEVAPTTGTPHLQCYVEFETKKVWNVVRSVLPATAADIAVRRGTQKQAIEYCMKDGDFIERGQKKCQGSRGDLDGIRVLALENGMREVVRIGNFQQIAVAKNVLTYHEEPRSWITRVLWFWGPTGTGKTRAASAIAGDDVYWKTGDTKWFDGYDAHESVIFDDLREDTFSFPYLLQLLDRYPCQVEVKGGFRQFKPRLIIVTCPLAPDNFLHSSCEDRTQLLRRITYVEHFVSRCPEVAGNN